MGEVYRGTVRHSGASVAVKVLKAELVADREVVGRFVQERSILTPISHPNVVRVIDLVVEGDTLAIVMELVRGRDLRRCLPGMQTHPPA
jgi:serine/threonine-protein kinase